MSPNLTLYTFKLSLWAGAGRLAVHELDIPNVKFQEVDISKAENFSPEYLAVNPKHTVPALQIEEDGKKEVKDDTKSVVEYFDSLAGNRLSIPAKEADIDAFIKEMHEEADVGNPLFLTSGSPEELNAKKGLIFSFVGGRIEGWETYLKQAPENADLYIKNIEQSKNIIEIYTSGNADQMYADNKHSWEVGQKFLDKAEALLKADGNFLFGEYSIAEIHFTPYLLRALMVRRPEQVFANRPSLQDYFKRLQARPSFAKTFA